MLGGFKVLFGIRLCFSCALGGGAVNGSCVAGVGSTCAYLDAMDFPYFLAEEVWSHITAGWHCVGTPVQTQLRRSHSERPVVRWGSSASVTGWPQGLIAEICEDEAHLDSVCTSAFGGNPGHPVCSLPAGITYGLWRTAGGMESANTNLTLKSVTSLISWGTICAYHSCAKVSRAQLVKQTLPKYNFHAYNTEYLTFHYSIPPKPKVYFLHSALPF